MGDDTMPTWLSTGVLPMRLASGTASPPSWGTDASSAPGEMVRAAVFAGGGADAGVKGTHSLPQWKPD